MKSILPYFLSLSLAATLAGCSSKPHRVDRIDSSAQSHSSQAASNPDSKYLREAVERVASVRISQDLWQKAVAGIKGKGILDYACGEKANYVDLGSCNDFPACIVAYSEKANLFVLMEGVRTEDYKTKPRQKPVPPRIIIAESKNNIPLVSRSYVLDVDGVFGAVKLIYDMYSIKDSCSLDEVLEKLAPYQEDNSVRATQEMKSALKTLAK
jgi:hypothetical protein